MRRLVLTSAALLAWAAANSAGAADLALKAPAAPPAWSWTGCYLGANAGGARAQNDAALSPGGSYLAAPGARPPPDLLGSGDLARDIAALSNSYSPANTGWEAGGQVGCNAQWGMAVLGVEGDWQWTNAGTGADAAYPAFANVGSPTFTDPAHTEHVDATQRWFATARLRAGFTPAERVLIYGTGGIAWANYNSNTAVTFATIPTGFFGQPYDGAVHVGSASVTQMGWVAGGGIEWALTNNWTVKAEYLYLRFDSFGYASPLTAAAVPFAPGYAWNTTITPHEQVARLGVNYKFNWGPVVAKY